MYQGIIHTLDDSIIVIDDLGKGGQAVGCAGGVGDNGETLVILLVVDAHHEHRGVSGGSRDDDLLGSSLGVGGGPVRGGEDPGGLHDVLGPGAGPGDALGVLLTEDGDGLAIDRQLAALGLTDLNISSVVSKVS